MKHINKLLAEIECAKKNCEDMNNFFEASVLEESDERIRYMNSLLEKAVEEIENLYGKETEFTEEIREALIDKEEKKNVVDWIIHYVLPEDDDPKFLVDAHTHGLESHNHLELMITIDLPEKIIGSIFNNLGIRIINGERFDEEKVYYNIIANNLPVKVIRTNIKEKEVAVLIFPDDKGRLPEDDGCGFPYNKQLEYLEYIKNR